MNFTQQKNKDENEFDVRFIDNGLENVAVAAARVVGGHRAAVIRKVKGVDVYKTIAKIIISCTSETTDSITSL